ncbi:ATPase, T2SS/T4P/T4SS family [Granulosicoccus sp. 3-233]|uniref:ATPase, T2SS/T4P/T4SS family n=1 Tax=Granulosicoccus sp. 3-233 TaxID=3417969 RepID=UPI003D33F75A
MFDFYYQHGKSRRKLFQAKGSHCSIGSARSNDLIMDTRLISKRHAELRLEHDGLYLRDLGSLSGTWVNRERIVEQGPLSELDEIEIGDISVSIRGIRGDSRSAAGLDPALRGGERFHSTGAESMARHHESKGSTVSASAPGLFAANRSGVGGTASTARLTGEHGSSAGLPPSPGGNHGTTEASHPVGGLHRNGSGSSPQGDEEHGSGVAVAEEAGRARSVAAVDTGSGIYAPGDNANRNSIGDSTGDSARADTARADSTRADSSHEQTVAGFDQALAYWGRVVHEQLLFQMDLRRKDVNRMSDDQLRKESSQLIAEIIASLSSQLPETLDRDRLQRNVLDESVGLGPVEQFLDDESITEIMVNNYQEIFVERAGKLERSAAHFSSDATVSAVIERIITPLGRRIDESSPIVDARLKDGSRVNAVIPPLALKGPSLTIRKFPKHRMQFSDLVACDSVSAAMVEFLRVCVEMRKNIVVSGGTGSGKTTLLNVLSNFIPDTDRIVTIEDAAELKLVQPNLVSLESRPANLEGKGEVPIRDLVRNSLRMRPDRIVVGECRGGEAIDMLQAMNTGHDGSLTTIHANTPRDVLSRLEVLVLMAGMDLPVTAIREQVASAVDLIIQQSRFPCGSRKITRITEVVGVESGTVQLQDIFRFEQQGVDESRRVRGYFSATGAIPSFYEELREIGIDVDLSFFSPRGQGGR